MIELVDGFFVDPFAVTVVKKISKDKCAIWLTGQSALDGFVLDYSADEVAEAITDACSDEPESDDREDDEEEENEDGQ